MRKFLLIVLLVTGCGDGHYETRSASQDTVFYGDSITRICQNYTYGLNRAVPGSDSGEMLEVIKDSIGRDSDASYHIMIGVNDIIKRTSKDYFIHINEALSLLDGPVIVTSILPTYSREINEQAIKLNEGLEALSDIHGFTYRNIYEDFLSGDTINPDYTFDGIHLNELGCSILF